MISKCIFPSPASTALLLTQSRKLHLEQEKSAKLLKRFEALEAAHNDAVNTIQDHRAEMDKLRETIRILHEGFERQEAVLGEAVLVNESYQAQISQMQKLMETCREDNAKGKRLDVEKRPDILSEYGSPGYSFKEERLDMELPPEPSECDFSSLYGGFLLGSPPRTSAPEKPWTPTTTVEAIEASTEKASRYFRSVRGMLVPSPAGHASKPVSPHKKHQLSVQTLPLGNIFTSRGVDEIGRAHV